MDEANRDKIEQLAKRRARYSQNKAYYREYYLKNRKRIIDRVKAQRSNSLEAQIKHRESNRRWIKNNPDKVKAYVQSRREKINAYYRARYHRLKALKP